MVQPEARRMQLQTILNHVGWCKSFVYESVAWSDSETKAALEVTLPMP
jgi:hypothetical protein